jgi:hypothetical protein
MWQCTSLSCLFSLPCSSHNSTEYTRQGFEAVQMFKCSIRKQIWDGHGIGFWCRTLVAIGCVAAVPLDAFQIGGILNIPLSLDPRARQVWPLDTDSWNQSDRRLVMSQSSTDRGFATTSFDRAWYKSHCWRIRRNHTSGIRARVPTTDRHGCSNIEIADAQSCNCSLDCQIR